MFAQTTAITGLNLKSIPQRWGPSLVIVVGLAGVVAVFTALLAMAVGFESTLKAAGRTDVAIVCEPRHRTWAGARVERLFQQFRIALVSADPARLPRSWELPAGIQYHRLHGSPRVYWSSYTPGYLQALAARITAERAILPEVWCIFDNTAAGAAWSNAEVLNARLRGS